MKPIANFVHGKYAKPSFISKVGYKFVLGWKLYVVYELQSDINGYFPIICTSMARQTGGFLNAAGDIVMNAICLDLWKPTGPSLAGNQANAQWGYLSGLVCTQGNTLPFWFTSVDAFYF